MTKPKFRCVIHGSLRRHYDEIQTAAKLFESAGIEVLAPDLSPVSQIKDGFAYFEGQENQDPRLIELKYLHNLRLLGENGFSYFVNPEGYVGKSASYELGVAQLTNVTAYFKEKPTDHPAYLPKSSVWTPQHLVDYIATHQRLPRPSVRKNEAQIHRLWQQLMVPGSVVAAGAIIEYRKPKSAAPPEILLVKTHKWGHKYSMVGGKLRRGERLIEAVRREIKEETGLASEVGRHLCTFDQIKDSGYYVPGIQHIFVDYVTRVPSKKVILNHEAQDFVWAPVEVALKELELEPNARHTVELYAETT